MISVMVLTFVTVLASVIVLVCVMASTRGMVLTLVMI